MFAGKCLACVGFFREGVGGTPLRVTLRRQTILRGKERGGRWDIEKLRGGGLAEKPEKRNVSSGGLGISDTRDGAFLKVDELFQSDNCAEKNV